MNQNALREREMIRTLGGRRNNGIALWDRPPILVGFGDEIIGPMLTLTLLYLIIY